MLLARKNNFSVYSIELEFFRVFKYKIYLKIINFLCFLILYNSLGFYMYVGTLASNIYQYIGYPDHALGPGSPRAAGVSGSVARFRA